MKLSVLYEDNHILVAEKPAGIPSQADASGAEDMLSLVKRYVKEQYHKSGEAYIGLLHRLDRPAAGLMLFARTSKAAARLSKQIREGRMQKVYLAVSRGENMPEQGRMEDFLCKDARLNLSRIAAPDDPGAKFAALEYEVLARQTGQALVCVYLLTGRPHQIRLQFASRGWPLLGDAKYGKGGQDLALYSCFLGFEHPTRKERMQFFSLPRASAFAPFAPAMEKLKFSG